MARASGKRRKVSREQIENSLARAGWHLDGGFADYLIIGYNEDGLSILAYEEEARDPHDDDPFFELIDHERDLTYGAWEIPTPEQAREMLQEHGKPPAAEDGYG